MLRRVRHVVRELPVIREEEEPFGIAVESPDGVHAGPDVCHQLGNTLAVHLIAHGGDEPAGLVQHDVARLLVLADLPAVDGHLIALRVDLVAHLCGLAVDLHLPCRDEFLTLPAGRDAAVCHIFL